MISHFENLAKRVGNTVSVDSFKRKTGAEDQRSLTFLSDALGMTLSTGVSGKKIPCVSKYPVKLIDKNIGTLVEYFRKNVIHIRYEADFKPFLKSTFSSEPQLVSAFDSLVNHSDEFIWNVEEGEKVVALRWDLLEYMPPRICWLLYENGAVDFRTSLSGSDLVKFYNIKARRFGDPTVTEDQLHSTHFVRDCWRIMPVGKKDTSVSGAPRMNLLTLMHMHRCISPRYLQLILTVSFIGLKRTALPESMRFRV